MASNGRGFFVSIVTFVIFACMGASFSQPQAQDFFPFSVWYSGGKARAPMLEKIIPESREGWKKDLQQIKGLGFNTVRTWVEWTANEPKPGEYHFENLDLLSELARELGLKVIIQVYTDSAPDWVAGLWPDAQFVAQGGQKIVSQAAPGYCFDHPEVRQKILSFYTETAEVANQHSNFHGWDLWSEPHIINWAVIDYVPNATFCYCPWTMKRFRTWLENKYKSLDGLNEAWYRTFTAWEQVEPPRFGTILSYTDYIDWRKFIQQKLAEDLALKNEAVKKVARDKVTTSHAAVPSLFTSPRWGVGAPDDWLMADSVDYWGTSIYPKHSFPERHWSLLTLCSLMDFTRSSGLTKPGFYVGELQAGMGIRGTVVGDPVTESDQKLWVLGMLSRGARAINVYAYYPMNSGYEAGGYGLINLDGSPTPRSKAIGRLAQLVDQNQELFLNGVPEQSDVAIIYNPLSHYVGGEQHLASGSVIRDSLQGIYSAFWKKNISTDFIHLQDVQKGRLEKYKLAILPYPLMLTEAASNQMAEFVRNGGHLVAEARCGWNDDRGFSQDIIPGFGLDQVFGVREGFLKMEEKVLMEWTGGPIGDIRRGARIIGKGIMEQLIPSAGAEVLARFMNGNTAITMNSFGKGKAILVGTFIGLSNQDAGESNVDNFLLGLAHGAGVKPLFQVTNVPGSTFLETRVLDSGSSRLIFIFNHSDQKYEPGISTGQAVDMESGAVVELQRIPMDSKQIRILLQEKK